MPLSPPTTSDAYSNTQVMLRESAGEVIFHSELLSTNLVGNITHPILVSFFSVIYQRPGFAIYLGVSLLCEQLNICHLFFGQVMLWAPCF